MALVVAPVMGQDNSCQMLTIPAVDMTVYPGYYNASISGDLHCPNGVISVDVYANDVLVKNFTGTHGGSQYTAGQVGEVTRFRFVGHTNMDGDKEKTVTFTVGNVTSPIETSKVKPAQAISPTAGPVIVPTSAPQNQAAPAATAIPATSDPGQGGGGQVTKLEAGYVQVGGYNANLRVQPDPSDKIQKVVITAGTILRYLGEATGTDGMRWLYVETQDHAKVGWMKARVVIIGDGTTVIPITVAQSVQPTVAILPQSTATPVIVDYLKKVKVVADAQVYTEIVTFTKFGWVTKDSIYEYVMTSSDGLWMQIKGSNGKTAWIAKSYVKPEQGSVEVRLTPTPLPTATGGAPATPVPTATVVNDPLKTVELLQNAPAYAAPSVDSIVVANGSANTKLNYHYSSQDGNWFFVSYQNTVSGWFPKSLLKKVSGTSEVLDPNIGVTVPTCGNTTTRLSLYGWGVSTQEGAPLNVREDSEQFTAKAKKLGQIPNGGKFQVIGLPKCVEGRNYWLVVHQIDAGHVLVGRIAESVDGKYTVEPLVQATVTPAPSPTPETGVG